MLSPVPKISSLQQLQLEVVPINVSHFLISNQTIFQFCRGLIWIQRRMLPRTSTASNCRWPAVQGVRRL